MSEKKQLNSEQLEKVNGGGNYASDEYLPANHGPHILMAEIHDHSDKYIGKKFYCVMDQHPKFYAVCTLCKVYKYRGYILIHEIHDRFYGKDNLECYAGDTAEYSVLNYTFYSYE